MIRHFKILFTILFFIITPFLYSAPLNPLFLSNEDFFTDGDGIIRMNINIIGHVKNPGIYTVYDGIDILSAITIGGGPMQGANLKRVHIYHQDGSNDIINLHKMFDGNKRTEVVIKPHDTIHIEQTKISEFITSSSLPSIILSLLNIALTLDRTD